MPAEPTEQLAIVLDAMERVITGIGDDQWADPTPCAEWSVGDVVNHVVGGNLRFAQAIAGEETAVPDPAQDADANPVGAFHASATAVLEAFRTPGALEKVVTVPFGTVPGIVALHLRLTEILVHGWDLARATGQDAQFPEEVAEQELRFSQAKVGEVPPGRKPFGPPQPVPNDAAAIDRLAACLGRSVGWSPTSVVPASP
ncbi:MAG TPA: TIGR03086 family metal-binding protein [Acidimicrobiales bacterium]|jgi:uncharacterized protein (TIGR03086 family)|nr:TIGR03086 family metal-binding protein [Acidimicrobiales bacterium]